MGLLHTLITLFIVLIVLVLLYPYLTNLLESITTGAQNFSIVQPPVQPTYVPSNALVVYALSLINHDRNTYGLQNVTASNITSAQQHADSMLEYSYFSHWDTYGMKPYMRYTLLGGTGAVDENIGYIYSSLGENVTKTLAQIEYDFVYNDEQCCNDGHRDNILDANHTQVSIGIAYNATTVYFVQDFINNYVSWMDNTPAADASQNVYLSGILTPGYNLTSVEVSYDPPIMNLTPAELADSPYNGPYAQGTVIAGVGYSRFGRRFFYPNITTVNATTYSIQANRFNVQFPLAGLIRQYGSGEYTVDLWLASGNSSGEFVGATYTFFVNGQDQLYVPNYV